MVISPRGSPGPRHSGSGALAWMSTRPFLTATPTTLQAMLLAAELVRWEVCIS